MTLIAYVEIDGLPVLVGDVLVSSETFNRAVVLPGSGRLSVDRPQYYYPTEYRQKLNKINDNLLIAWAGPKIVADTLVSHLRNISSPSDRDETQALLEELIRDFSKTKLGNEFSFVAMFVDTEGPIPLAVAPYNMEHVDIEGYGNVFVAGSGVGAMKDYLRENSNALEGDGENIDRGRRAVRPVYSHSRWKIVVMESMDGRMRNNIIYFGRPNRPAVRRVHFQ